MFKETEKGQTHFCEACEEDIKKRYTANPFNHTCHPLQPSKKEKNIIVMIFLEKDAPDTRDWLSVYKFKESQRDVVDKELTAIQDGR